MVHTCVDGTTEWMVNTCTYRILGEISTERISVWMTHDGILMSELRLSSGSIPFLKCTACAFPKMFTIQDSQTLENVYFAITSLTLKNFHNLRLRSHDQNHVQKMKRLKHIISLSHFFSEMFTVICSFGCMRSNMLNFEFEAYTQPGFITHQLSLHPPQRHQ